jgi:hypothetical protein
MAGDIRVKSIHIILQEVASMRDVVLHWNAETYQWEITGNGGSNPTLYPRHIELLSALNQLLLREKR